MYTTSLDSRFLTTQATKCCAGRDKLAKQSTMTTPQTDTTYDPNTKLISQPADAVEISSSASEAKETRELKPEPNESGIASVFNPPRRRWEGWILLALYTPLLNVPWVLTCILNFRPISLPSYIDHAGHYPPPAFENDVRWLDAVRVMNTAAAVLTIPITSLLIARAAVVFLQRRGRSRSKITLAHFFELADRGWMDARIIWKQIDPNNGEERKALPRNWWILSSSGFLGLCAVTLPLQQLLINAKTIKVVTCKDVPYLPATLEMPAWYLLATSAIRKRL